MKVEIDYKKWTATVQKPAVEKYARKLVQEQLQKDGNYGWEVGTFYKGVDGINSDQETQWYFYLTAYAHMKLGGYFKEAR